MKSLLIPSLIIWLSACADTAIKNYALPEQLAQPTDTSTLACRYTKQTSDAKNQSATNWYFWRQPQRTETRDELSNQGEVWERNQTEQLFYTRLFYNEKVALEFVPGDLAATGVEPAWEQLTTLVNRRSLGKELALLNKTTSAGLDIEFYRGTINNVDTEIDWIPALQLPARIAKRFPDAAVTLTLSDCGQAAKFSVKPISKSELDNMRRIDFTDLGDMEDDLMVRHIEQLMSRHQHP